MQGSAADIIKLAMINVHHWLINDDVPAKIVMQVHDELVLEVNENNSQEIKESIIKLMESVTKIDVPLIVDAAIGSNWEEAH